MGIEQKTNAQLYLYCSIVFTRKTILRRFFEKIFSNSFGGAADVVVAFSVCCLSLSSLSIRSGGAHTQEITWLPDKGQCSTNVSVSVHLSFVPFRILFCFLLSRSLRLSLPPIIFIYFCFSFAQFILCVCFPVVVCHPISFLLDSLYDFVSLHSFTFSSLSRFIRSVCLCVLFSSLAAFVFRFFFVWGYNIYGCCI